MKYRTVVTEAHGGNHNTEQTKAAWEWIDWCSRNYSEARLYHLCFIGSTYTNQQLVRKRLMQQLKRKGMAASFIGAREISEKKGEHYHVYLCCDSSRTGINPCSIITRTTGGWLQSLCTDHDIKLQINPPRGLMHVRNSLDGCKAPTTPNYSTLPRSKPEKVADAKVRISYLFKRDTKPVGGQIYTSSRNYRSEGIKTIH